MLNRIFILLFIILSTLLLTSSANAFLLAKLGLGLWFERMVPTLLPFMMLSSVMTGLNLQDAFCRPVQKLFKRLFSLSENETYCIVMGFLCGFPMGAFCSAELCRSGRITRRSAQTLVAFCNNIGPIYFFNYALGMIGFHALTSGMYILLFIGMYGIPILYGSVSLCRMKHVQSQNDTFTVKNPEPVSLFCAIDSAINRSGMSILRLCGYMVLFNVLMLPFYGPGKHLRMIRLLHCFMEISGGLQLMQNSLPGIAGISIWHNTVPVFQILMLTALSFGGLSCIGQTSVFLQEAGLSVRSYVKSRICIAILTCLYYILCFRFGMLSF